MAARGVATESRNKGAGRTFCVITRPLFRSARGKNRVPSGALFQEDVLRAWLTNSRIERCRIYGISRCEPAPERSAVRPRRVGNRRRAGLGVPFLRNRRSAETSSPPRRLGRGINSAERVVAGMFPTLGALVSHSLHFERVRCGVLGWRRSPTAAQCFGASVVVGVFKVVSESVSRERLWFGLSFLKFHVGDSSRLVRGL